jgi:hypothetical protein
MLDLVKRKVLELCQNFSCTSTTTRLRNNRNVLSTQSTEARFYNNENSGSHSSSCTVFRFDGILGYLGRH